MLWPSQAVTCSSRWHLHMTTAAAATAGEESTTCRNGLDHLLMLEDAYSTIYQQNLQDPELSGQVTTTPAVAGSNTPPACSGLGCPPPLIHPAMCISSSNGLWLSTLVLVGNAGLS
jgi:hypothetical protein